MFSVTNIAVIFLDNTDYITDVEKFILDSCDEPELYCFLQGVSEKKTDAVKKMYESLPTHLHLTHIRDGECPDVKMTIEHILIGNHSNNIRADVTLASPYHAAVITTFSLGGRVAVHYTRRKAAGPDGSTVTFGTDRLGDPIIPYYLLKERDIMIIRAIAELQESSKTVTYDDVAKKMGMPYKTVAGRMNRIKKEYDDTFFKTTHRRLELTNDQLTMFAMFARKDSLRDADDDE